MSQIDQKSTKTCLNEFKPRETSQSNPLEVVKQPEMTQNFKIGEVWNLLLAFVFQICSPSAHIWAFRAKKYRLSNLNQTLYVSNLVGVDFKSDICF